MRTLQILILSLLFAVPALAGVTVSASEDHYIVQGSTVGQIANFYKQREEKYSAYAQPTFKYNYTWVKHENTCSITEVNIHLHITYVYPHLAGSPGKHTQKWWDNILKKLSVHERIHGEIAKESAHELERELKKIKNIPYSNVKNTVTSQANFIFRKHQQLQEDYDRLTEHGMKQERYKKQ